MRCLVHGSIIAAGLALALPQPLLAQAPAAVTQLRAGLEQGKLSGVVDWLKADYGLGRGHAMALHHVIKNGPTISTQHVGTTGVHRDESDVLWLDGRATRPS